MNSPMLHIRPFNKLKKYFLKIAAFFNKRTPKSLQNFLALWAPIFLLLCLQPLANWIKDKNQITDLLIPLILISASSTLLTIVFYRAFLKNRFVALVFALGAQYAVIQRIDIRLQPVWNYLRSFRIVLKMIDALGLINLLIFATLAILLLNLLFRLIDKFIKTRKWNLDILFRGIVIAIVAAFSIQTFTILQITIGRWPQFFYRPNNSIVKETLRGDAEKPDIYYIVLDRYTNQNVLKDQFDFNNSDFITYLEKNGFSINPDSYGNYPNTITSISSTLTADYHSTLSKNFGSTTDQTYASYFNSIKYAPVIKDLKKIGYSYYHLGTFYDMDNQAPLADHYYSLENQLIILNHSFTLNNFSNKEITRSIWRDVGRQSLKIGNLTIFSYQDAEQPDWIKYKLSKLKQITGEETESKFVFAHFLTPHNPFYFNADGSLSDNPLIDNQGKPVKQKYIDQIKFINDQMKEIVDKIKQKNNQAVIVIQSDEGTYSSNFLDKPNDTMEFDNSAPEDEKVKSRKLKYGVLAAYHIPNAKKEDLQAAGDNVNVFRLIFNTYFDAKLPYLPKCSYIFDPSSIYKYLDITNELYGQDNPECPKDSIF